MNFKRGISLGLVSLMSINMLCGCGSGNKQINELKSLKALNSESTVSNYKMSYSESQSLVYAQVSDRTLLDLSKLESCSDNELQAVQNYMNNVDNQLIGSIPADNGTISAQFTDYLLTEFEQSPYYWQRSSMVVRGKDAESGAIIADVTYKTIDFKKEVIPDSIIPIGSPNYEQQMQVRYQRWINLLTMKYGGNGNNVSNFESSMKEFKEAYGEPKDIIASQSLKSLTDNIYQTGNQVTYTGMTDSVEEESGGTMTVRYIIVPNYVLGVNLGLTCKHMYIVDYNIEKDPTEGLELFTAEGYQTVTDAVYEMLYSYFQCIDEDDYSGLNKLTTNFGNVDKYWKDLFNSSYRKHNNFTLSIFDITGTHITCGSTVSTKIRAKGSDMTMPSYTDRYYFEIELVEDQLKVTNMILLSRTLEGEPAITTDSADTAGFVASVDLDNEDKVEIEKLIQGFSHLQLLKDVTSDEFGDIVDLSMSSASLTSLKENFTLISGAKKAVWLQTYMEGTDNFASLKCRELFQAEDNSIIEASVVYQFISKGNRWYVYGYDITSQAKLDTTNLATTGNLCVIDKDGVVSYTSQVTNTDSTVDIDNLTDISVAYDYDAYTPVLKTGVTEQGLNKMTVNALNDSIIEQTMSLYVDKVSSISNWKEVVSALPQDNEGREVFKEGVCILYNITQNLYMNDDEKREVVQKWTKAKDEIADKWSSDNEALANMKVLLSSMERMM